MRRSVPASLALFAVAVLSCSKNDVLGPAGPRGCIHYADYLHITGGVDTPGVALDAAVVGSYAYVADERSGLQVIDISNPVSPRVLGCVTTRDDASDVALAGSCVCVAVRFQGLVTVPVQCAELP